MSIQEYIFFMGLICLIPLFYYIWKKSMDPSLGMLVFFAFFFTNAEYLYRAWMALLISLCAYPYVVARQWKKFLLVLLLAACFHRSVLVIIPIYWLYSIRPAGWKLGASLIAAVFCVLTGDFWRTFLSRFARFPLEAGGKGGMGMLLFLWSALVIVYLLAHQHLNNPRFRLWFLMLWVAALTQPLCFSFSLWSRAQMFFTVSLCTLLPETIQLFCRAPRNRRFWMGIRVAFMLLLYVHVYFAYRNEFFAFGQW